MDGPPLFCFHLFTHFHARVTPGSVTRTHAHNLTISLPSLLRTGRIHSITRNDTVTLTERPTCF